MKYKAAMETQDRDNWEAAVEEERNNMEKYSLWTPRILKDVPAGSKVITYTWSTKKKAKSNLP